MLGTSTKPLTQQDLHECLIERRDTTYSLPKLTHKSNHHSGVGLGGSRKNGVGG